MASYRRDNRPKTSSLVKLALLSTLVKRGKIPLEWILMKLKDSRSLIRVLGKIILLKLPED